MTSSLPEAPAASVVLAVDFGGTKVEAALVTSEAVVVPGSRFRAPTGPLSASDVLAEAVLGVARRALAELPEGTVLSGVGIGCAGPVAVREGRVSPLNVPAWRDFPLRDLLQDLVGESVPVALQMDGLCITLAEHWVGAARGYDDVLGMIVSTGIGGGLILDGRTVSGPTGNAGHIGHIEVGGLDVPCKCGGTGCVEAVASGPNIVRWAREQGWTGSTGEDLAAGYASGDELAIAAVRRAGRAIGQAIASATALVDVSVVAIGGGFSLVTPDLFGFIREAIAEREAFGFVTKVVVVPSGLSSDGPLIGSAALIHRAAMVPAHR